MPDMGLFQTVFTFNIMTPVASTGKPTSSGVLMRSLAFCVWVPEAASHPTEWEGRVQKLLFQNSLGDK